MSARFRMRIGHPAASAPPSPPEASATHVRRMHVQATHPMRWVASSELAYAVMFLASEGAATIHGVALPVIGLV